MKFYCTAGRGTGLFVAKELKQVFGPDTKISSTDGKSYFEINGAGVTDLQLKIMSLKTVERVFVEVYHENFQKLDRRGLLTLLHTRLKEKAIWEDCISTLKHFPVSTHLHLSCASSKIQEDIKVSVVNFMDKTLGSTSEVPKVGIDTQQTGSSVSEVDTNTSIPYTDSGQGILQVDMDTNPLRTDVKRRMSEDDTYTDVSQAQTSVSDIKVPEVGTSDIEQTANDNNTEIVKDNSVTCEPAPAAKRMKVDEIDAVTFRVSCRFSGFARKQLNIQRTSQQMGVLISKLLGWRIDLRHPKYEINIYLSDDMFTVGIPVTNSPLSKRSYIKHCGLRAPVAYIMASLLDIGPGYVVLDPMCGSGTILVEASQTCQKAVYIGMDNSVSQLSLAAENIRDNNMRTCCMSLIHGDVRHMPLPDSCVDGVVTDAPFGQNHTVKGSLHVFYLKMLSELSRVVRPTGKIVLLSSSCMVNFMMQACKEFPTCSSSSEQKPSQDTCTFSLKEDSGNLDKFKHSVCMNVSRNRTDVTEISTPEDNITTRTCSKYSNMSQCESSNSDTDLMPSLDHFTFTLKATYNVKLGETEGCIFVILNTEKLK